MKNKKCLFIYLVIATISLPFILFANFKNNSNLQNNSADIGGEFNLISHQNKNFTNKDLKGKNSIIFFGFSNCPGICPTALTNITEALNIISDKHLKSIIPVFITLDYKRDNTAILADYISNFHSKFIALTGGETQIQTALNNYKIYANEMPANENGDYMINHSAFIYFMNKKNNYITHLAYDADPSVIAETIKKVF